MFSGSLISLDDLTGHPDLQHLGLRRNTVRNWLRKGVAAQGIQGWAAVAHPLGRSIRVLSEVRG